ncbi:hypothetical protein [Aurantimonas sp. NFXS3]|uniref:hypothetical protein n=1 Tax=Aurantimonas sp. NFXS3 TaxID=2818434 RepID=UPI003B8B2D7F
MFTLAVLYLLVPAAIVLLAFSSWPMVLLSLLGLAAAAYAYRQQENLSGDEAPNLSYYWPLMIVAAGAVWLSGVLPPFQPNGDWTKHYALFNTLRDNAWPPTIDIGQGPATLRYSLGWYVMPALAAKILGKSFTGLAIFAWTGLGLFIVLRLAFRDLQRPSQLFSAGLIFICFSGADVLGMWITGYEPGHWQHLEWWAGFASLPSNVTSVFWTPQHAIPAWIGAMLFLRYPERALAFGGPLAAAILLWSPFAAIGMAPVALWAMWHSGWRHALTTANYVAGPALVIPAILYLGEGTGDIPVGLSIGYPGFSWPVWGWFVFLEIAAIGAAISISRPSTTPLLLICGGFVIALTLTRVGAFNDLTMRGCLPAIGIFAALAAGTLIQTGYRRTLMVACFVAGLPTAGGEIMRGLVTPPFADPYDLTLQDVLLGQETLATQYLVPLR